MNIQALRKSSKLDKAIFASVAAVLSMNIFVLAQQLDSAPLFALSSAPPAQQA